LVEQQTENLRVPSSILGGATLRAQVLESFHATLAQLVEQLIRNQQVVGSTPMGGFDLSLRYDCIRSRVFSGHADISTVIVYDDRRHDFQDQVAKLVATQG
jgi:hypothetical protein